MATILGEKKEQTKPTAASTRPLVAVVGYTIAFLIAVTSFVVLENLPFVVARSPTLEEVETAFGPAYPASYSSYLTFTLPPSTTIEGFGTIVTNTLGYRGRFPQQVSKPEGVRRLLFVGDSFTLGWGLEERHTLPARLQGWLDQRQLDWEVINAAYHAGCSPDAYYAYLRQEGLRLEPDLIVVLLYTGNDIEDLRDNVWTAIDEGGAPVSLYSIRTYTDYRGRMLNPRLLPWYYHVPLLNRSHVLLTLAGGITRLVTGEAILRSGRAGTQLPETEAWRRFAIVTKATVDLARRNGVPIVYATLGLPGTRSSEDQVLARIRQLLETELKIPFVVMHDRLGPEHQLPGDAHLNEGGTRVAAEVLCGFLGGFLGLRDDTLVVKAGRTGPGEASAH